MLVIIIDLFNHLELYITIPEFLIVILIVILILQKYLKYSQQENDPKK